MTPGNRARFVPSTFRPLHAQSLGDSDQSIEWAIRAAYHSDAPTCHRATDRPDDIVTIRSAGMDHAALSREGVAFGSEAEFGQETSEAWVGSQAPIAR